MDKKQYSLTIVLALVAGLVGGLLANQLFVPEPAYGQKSPTFETVIAKQFHLVDKKGSPRGSFTLDPDGGVALGFMDNNKEVRIMLRLEADGNTHLAFRDNQGKFSMILGTRGGDRMFRLSSRNSVQIAADADGMSMTFYDENNTPRLSLGSLEGRVAGITLADKSKRVIWKAP